jgi:hypothetical protein
MTKSRHPLKALEAADKIAMKRMRYIRCTPEWLEREAHEEIANLKMYPSSQEISRELWICSRKYFIRFISASVSLRQI